MSAKIVVKDLNFYYNNHKVLSDLNLTVETNSILGIMGPAKSGKTTLLRVFNRLCDLIPNIRVDGGVFLDGENILRPDLNIDTLRTKVGMVFDKPVPLPRSIFENLAYSPRIHGMKDKRRLEELVERSLRLAQLWDEVKDRLNESAMKLSGGQQQRLCIARTLAMEPEIILLDEPTYGLDPISTLKIEQALQSLKKNYTIVLVSNNTWQVARTSDNVAFLLMGELVEYGSTHEIFTVPKDKRTDDYISGRFG
ncbi:MAG: phosphate ABC transporter ATP-binding protein [Thermodesulfovibrionales bacterium]|nr:phosphate ABC transporter ATP-binding protein [Thermodesulfovibrionales bacterium]